MCEHPGVGFNKNIVNLYSRYYTNRYVAYKVIYVRQSVATYITTDVQGKNHNP